MLSNAFENIVSEYVSRAFLPKGCKISELSGKTFKCNYVLKFPLVFHITSFCRQLKSLRENKKQRNVFKKDRRRDLNLDYFSDINLYHEGSIGVSSAYK